MLVMVPVFEQMELFPTATKQDIKAAKSLLRRYHRMRLIVDDFDRNGPTDLPPKQKAIYNAYKQQLDLIDRAVRLITDDDVRRMVELRYIKGQPHKIIVARFALWHPSTVDRKINKGIKSVANMLRLLE